MMFLRIMLCSLHRKPPGMPAHVGFDTVLTSTMFDRLPVYYLRHRPREGPLKGRKFALSKAQVRLAQVAMAQRDTSILDLCKELGIERATGTGERMVENVAKLALCRLTR